MAKPPARKSQPKKVTPVAKQAAVTEPVKAPEPTLGPAPHTAEEFTITMPNSWKFNPKRPLGLTEITELFQMLNIVMTGEDAFNKCSPAMKQHFERIEDK